MGFREGRGSGGLTFEVTRVKEGGGDGMERWRDKAGNDKYVRETHRVRLGPPSGKGRYSTRVQ